MSEEQRQRRLRARLRVAERAAGGSDIGCVRTRNEDAFWVDEQARFVLVADGLGGLPSGDVASATAVEEAASIVAGVLDHSRLGPADVEVAELLLREAFAAAHRAILDRARADVRHRGMATTLVGAVVLATHAVFLHVGDVRGYVWSAGHARFVTADHSRVGALVREGLLTREQARHRPDRNVVTEVLGLAEGYSAEADIVDFSDGDVLMLCSDGLWEGLAEAHLSAILDAHRASAEAVEALLAAARDGGGRDNITVALVDRRRA